MLSGGYVEDALDCDDSDPDRRPGADEWCNGADDDCDGETDEAALDLRAWPRDLDGDGFGDGEALPVVACAQPAHTVDNANVCDDGDPGATRPRRSTAMGGTKTANG